MRDAFAASITELAAIDERVCLLVGDLGNHLWDTFRERFPSRWYNCGIAEQNMVSVAAGIALAGLRPFVYSIASFAVFRCFEQIRVDVCYHNLSVVIVGVGAGLSYAKLGPTHHACEDIAVMRALPGMTVVSPCDPVETGLAVPAAVGVNGPVYLRLGKNGEPTLHSDASFDIGKFRMLRFRGWEYSRKYVCILASGPIAAVACDVQRILTEQGIGCTVISVHTVKPLDETWLRNCLESFDLFVTVEEHSLIGGLASAVMEHVDGKLIAFGTDDAFLHNVGGREEALEACVLTAEKIAGKIMEVLAK